MGTIALPDDLIQKMLKHNEELAASNGIDLDYSEASVKQFDALLNDFHEGYINDPEPDRDSLSGIALCVGMYIGEALKKGKSANIQWKYGIPAPGGSATPYLFQDGNEVYPVDWVAKQIMDGSEASVLKKFRKYKKQLR